jgi:hypothetical protein
LRAGQQNEELPPWEGEEDDDWFDGSGGVDGSDPAAAADAADDGDAAAVLRGHQRATLALYQQRLIDLGCTEEMQRQLQELHEEWAREQAALLQALRPLGGEPAEDPPCPDADEVARIEARAAKFKERLGQPLYTGCRAANALEADFLLFQWRHNYGVGARAFDALLTLLADKLLPQDNLLPASLYLMRKASGAPHGRGTCNRHAAK